MFVEDADEARWRVKGVSSVACAIRIARAAVAGVNALATGTGSLIDPAPARSALLSSPKRDYSGSQPTTRLIALSP